MNIKFGNPNTNTLKDEWFVFLKESEGQDKLWDEVINQARFYDGSPNDLIGLNNWLKSQFTITRNTTIHRAEKKKIMDRITELETELKNANESIGKIQDNIENETIVLQLQCVRESILEALDRKLNPKKLICKNCGDWYGININHRCYKCLQENFINEPEKFTCYEIWRPNIPAYGCSEQCKECKEKQTKQPC